MKQLVIILCVCTFYFSCKKEEESKNKSYNNNEEEELIITRAPVSTPVPALEANELKYRLILPETLQVNKPYNAVIEFESDFDAIVDPIQYAIELDSTKDRLVRFFHYEPQKLSSKNEAKNTDKEPIYVSNKKFTVENIVFKERGEYMFEGYIFDEIRYIFYDDQGKRDSVHFDQRRQMIKKKVVVVD